jgi:hypothetical protein
LNHSPGLFWHTLNSFGGQTSLVKLQQFPITTPEAKTLHSNIICILAQKAEYLQLIVDQQDLVPKPRLTGFQLQPALRQQSGTQCNVPHQQQISEIFQRVTNVHHSAGGALANVEHLSVSLIEY